jgi:hypothetical protein
VPAVVADLGRGRGHRAQMPSVRPSLIGSIPATTTSFSLRSSGRLERIAGDRLFKSLLPDVAANEYAPVCKVFSVIAAKIRVDTRRRTSRT